MQNENEKKNWKSLMTVFYINTDRQIETETIMMLIYDNKLTKKKT